MTSSSEPRRLYSVNEVAALLGVSRKWVHNRLKNNGAAPKPEFCTFYNGKDAMLLWTDVAVDRWRAFHASTESVPFAGRFFSYSDHQAVNTFRDVAVTWKLWWQNLPHGDTMWWFSTPHGWWTSTDDGRTWLDSGLEVRPPEYKYFCVNGGVRPVGAVSVVLRSALELRKKLDGELEGRSA